MARTTALWMAGMAGFVLVLELLFQLLPVSSSTETGYYTNPLILTYPPYHRWTMSTGWDLRNAQTLEANNLGYVADHDFERNEHAVALVGDSFIEASMLATPDRPGAQLERVLGSRPVYAMGCPGTSLLDYAERIRFAQEKFGIRDFVVFMERGDVMQSLCGSGNSHGPCLDRTTLVPRNETLPSAGTVKRLLRHSAFAQYLVSQLKLSPQKLWQQALAPSQPVTVAGHGLARGPTGTELLNATEATMRDVDAVTNTFFERARPHITGQLVIVIDSNRRALYDGQMTPDPARARFIALARAAGATVIDTEPLFRAHLAKSPLLLDVGPYDTHLNKLGVSIFTQAAASALSRQ